MRGARVTLVVVTALLLIGGSAWAQPFQNPELADVETAFFYDLPKSGTSVVIASIYGGYGNAFARFHGARYGRTRNGGAGVVVFHLYEPDDIKRSGAGSWQVKQSDFVQMAFWLSTPYGHFTSNAFPSMGSVTGLYSYSGVPIVVPPPMYFVGSPSVAQIEGCNASITTKDRNRDGLPESASWKAGCNPKALGWLSKDDQKLYKKILKGLKGKGVFPAYRSFFY